MATLTVLSVVLVTASLCALTGRQFAARVAGWLAAVPTAAALALAVSGALRIRTERWLVEVAAHATAAAALSRDLRHLRTAVGHMT